jgi:hypothetical protein
MRLATILAYSVGGGLVRQKMDSALAFSAKFCDRATFGIAAYFYEDPRFLGGLLTFRRTWDYAVVASLPAPNIEV